MTDQATTIDEVQARIAQAMASDDLAAIEREFIGKDGVVARQLAAIPDLPPAERKDAGQSANRLKQAVLAALEGARASLAGAALDAERAAVGFDRTLPSPRIERGGLHPIVQVTRELEDLFTSMGYQVLDGPEVELDLYNFEKLNIPADHPARDSQDTFYVERRGTSGEAGVGPDPTLVLRTHTSPVQVRAMERLKPPFRAIVPGKVFRQEDVDASHEHTFHQMEGLVIDKGISVGHLVHAMRTLLRGIFHRELDVRLRPGYFPFVEPGFELDARCPFCETGCSVCKGTTWVELLPCGLVHPSVLRHAGLDPEIWGGFAFGLGLSRLVMLRFGIDDVRHLLSGDLRFLNQF